MQRIYLDYNATTPMAQEVLDLLKTGSTYGNPSSIHWAGREAREQLNKARQTVATHLGAEAKEILFTSGGTEAINLAIKGLFYGSNRSKKHFVTTTVEHKAVSETIAFLVREEGCEVTSVGVDSRGRLSLDALEQAIRSDTLLVSIQAANNETGNLFPLHEIANLTQKKKVPLHVDAVQAIGKIPLNVRELGIDLLSLSAHKIYGPKGSGALYVRQGVPVQPVIHGGSQEREKRGGTENLWGAIGLARALELVSEERGREYERLLSLRERLEAAVLKIPGSFLNGDPEHRLPNTSNFSFEGISNESLLVALDLEGFAVSAGSACASGSIEPSPVLLAMGRNKAEAKGAIRVSLGRLTTPMEIELFVSALPKSVQRLREKY